MFRGMLVIVLMLMVQSVATAAYDESRIRSTQSNEWAYVNDRGTVTGYRGDYVIFTDCNGKIVDCHTVQWWVDQFKGGKTDRVFKIEDHSGGQTSVRFCYFAFADDFPALKGGTVSLRRNSPSGELIDSDRLK